ncbi:DUF859 family phage minor structural protein [Bittarella massiliensis (ex Durand et al. 2017)]|uniref:DUF859 family phage minor structural protein n=1 Tax=Bittarella massiliensis (ex Durand et al. 2017) TaxID=1720313 RepID=UPI001AA0D237|nr:DUF859 family phage minor structural protein [Bittarella massiliensis (ex Durand et al. 2017)]MBO1680663.1 hypothetical protein [Bittarella massiliensis (ex Durand et al. 2017)]
MASSGSWYTNFGGGHYQLTLSWSASQSVSGNYSDISARLYITCFGGWSISANATKYGNITIDGDQIDFTTAIGSISAGNTPKQLASASKRVYHSADGSKYLNITASLGVDVTISGVGHIGTVNVNSSNSLDDIPRASSVSLANFTAGDNVTVNISRASGNFTHSIQLDVGGVAIKTASGVGTSHTWSFTEADIKKIYAAMGSAGSASATVWCNTYSGSTLVGDAHTNATCYQVGNSALQTAPTFVVGDSRTYTVDRLRGSVSHTLQLFAGSTLIRTATGVGTSYSLALTEAEIAKVYALGMSVPTRMVCTAYHCGRNIGTSQLTGTASAPPASSITSKPDHTIGGGYTTAISRSRNAVSHTLRLYVAGRQIKEIGGVATAYTWTPTAAEVAAEYAATPNSNTAAAQATIWCYHYGKLIGTATASGTAAVDPAAAAPVFSGFSFADTRPATTALTGDDQVLVAGESALKVTVPAAQAAKSTTGASVKQYILSCGGATATGAYAASGDVSIQMERAKAGSVRLAAVDSRGNQTVVERLAALVDYIPPRVTQMQLRRDNNVDNKTKLTVKGVWWPGNFGEVDNALEARYRYKITSAEEFVEGDVIPLTFQKGEWSYEGYLPGDMGAEGFDFQKSFLVEVTVADALNTAAETETVDRGIPTMYMDKSGVGIGKIRENGALDVEGEITGTKLKVVENGQTMYTRGESQAYFDFYTSADNFWFEKPLRINGGHLVYHEGYNPKTIDSLGNLNPETGRTATRGNIYTYNTVSGNTGAPVTYTSVLGFGRGWAGGIELCGDWLGGKGLWVRSLRDTTDSWTPWTRIYTEAYKPTPAQIGALSTARDVTINWANGGFYITFSGNFQICTKFISGTAAVTNPWGNSYESTSSFDFGLWPRKFSKEPHTFVALGPSPNSGAYSVEPLNGTSVTNIGKTYLYRSANASTNVPFTLFAFGIGEWK